MDKHENYKSLNPLLSPLSGWLNRKHPLPVRFYEQNFFDKPNAEWLTWVSLEEISPLHEVNKMKWMSLLDSRRLTQKYLNTASKIINGLEGGWLDHEEQFMILEKIGNPPNPSLPIYIISCDEGPKEHIVYIGKTEKKSRFTGGHSAALKLSAPKYDGLKKNVYRCSIWFYCNDEYIFLDWVQPESTSFKLLDSIESKLIYHFQPELNTSKKRKDYSKYDLPIHIQNIIGSGFLNDTFF